MSSRISSFGCTLESLESRQLLSGGALDTSFNDDGKATIDFGGGVKVSANDVAVQTDGKTVVAGDASNGNLALARFNIDGSLDTTFGANHDGIHFSALHHMTRHAVSDNGYRNVVFCKFPGR